MEPVYKLAYDFLKSKKIDVYVPGTHNGDCISNYCVLKDSGAAQVGNFSSQIKLYTIFCYSPKYSQLDDYVSVVKTAMREIAPTLMPTGQETPSFYDDTNKGYMISIQYRSYKRNNQL